MENNKNVRLKKIFKKYLFLRGNRDDKAGKEDATVMKKEDAPKKSSAAEKRADVTVESADAVKPPPKLIQKKKKKVVNVEKVKRIEDEEKEEFEVVQNARPAVCHPLHERKNKLQWKREKQEEQQPQSESDTEQAEKAHDEILVEKTQEKQMDPLKDAVAELTLEKQQLNDVIENLRKKMRHKNRLIEQLRKELGKNTEEQTQEEKEPKEQKEGDTVKQLRQELEETKTALRAQIAKNRADQEEIQKLRKDKEEKWIGGTKEPVEEEKVIDEATLAVAKRTLELMKRNQLLENALGYKETGDLQKFFATAAPNTQPNDNVLALLDKAMSVAMDSLAKRPHDLDDIIDNPMRRFIHSPTAKETLLETMLSTPGMLPSSWAIEGGKAKNTASDTGKKEYVKSVYLYPR